MEQGWELTHWRSSVSAVDASMQAPVCTSAAFYFWDFFFDAICELIYGGYIQSTHARDIANSYEILKIKL
jgi:hypothetical protein